MTVSERDTATRAEAAKAARRKRTNQLKKIIIGSIVVAVLIPITTCFILLCQVRSLKEQIKVINSKCNMLLEAVTDVPIYNENEEEVDWQEIMTGTEQDVVEEEQSIHRKQACRKVYLTFDDGPSENTERILAILEEYGVKATFFVTGEQALKYPERYKAIVEGGHVIGMHSYSHRYDEIYQSVENFGSDLRELQKFLKEITGVTPTLYRFPGGSSNTVSKKPMSVFCDYLTDNGITYMDWNISSEDAVIPMISAEEIAKNCTEKLEDYENAVILLHDAVNKESTIEALPLIIEDILTMEDTEILPITDETVVIHHN